MKESQIEVGVKPTAGVLAKFTQVRARTEGICEPLLLEDYSAQPADFVSPPKWHLAHTTWFWEEFLLVPHCQGYRRFNSEYNYFWNSYYNTKGDRVPRAHRGQLTRPTVAEVYDYRKAVDDAMMEFLQTDRVSECSHILEVGLQHEEQHQELLYYDIKYILGNQPSLPTYRDDLTPQVTKQVNQWCELGEGVYEIGHDGSGFGFDNEFSRHKVYLGSCQLAKHPVTNADYREFIQDQGYQQHHHWHDEGWHWIKVQGVKAPLYWHDREGEWFEFDLNGIHPLNPEKPVAHISYYEAVAFASWREQRLPTEAEWEVLSTQLDYGYNWEWTQSAYLPYPGFVKAPGALGEYNGKFMVNQMVLRGRSDVTPRGHSRATYRNFFHPQMRWQYAGLRLAQEI